MLPVQLIEFVLVENTCDVMCLSDVKIVENDPVHEIRLSGKNVHYRPLPYPLVTMAGINLRWIRDCLMVRGSHEV